MESEETVHILQDEAIGCTLTVVTIHVSCHPVHFSFTKVATGQVPQHFCWPYALLQLQREEARGTTAVASVVALKPPPSPPPPPFQFGRRGGNGEIGMMALPPWSPALMLPPATPCFNLQEVVEAVAGWSRYTGDTASCPILFQLPCSPSLMYYSVLKLNE